ncbi:hypothetical protein ACIQCJ_14725 [Streptomyces sp. NPDC093221]|uniref:hypothetical protein n=1 Tax=Streptomyces sp. NPDC093221 TaxID=3366032 RepID=UPI0037FB9247
MSRVLKRITMTPECRQIMVRDFGTSDAPEWETGDEPLAWFPGSFMIGTVDDTDGDVTVEVRLGAADTPGARTIFDGIFSCTSGIVSIMTPTEYDNETLRLPRAGDWKMRIAVKGAERPDYVAIIFDDKEWSTALT